jgi:hypothetical protein
VLGRFHLVGASRSLGRGAYDVPAHMIGVLVRRSRDEAKLLAGWLPLKSFEFAGDPEPPILRLRSLIARAAEL